MLCDNSVLALLYHKASKAWIRVIGCPSECCLAAKVPFVFGKLDAEAVFFD
jgi:hypothetical protein